MKRLILALLAVLLAFFGSYAMAENDETDEEVRQELESEIDNQLDDVDIRSWEDILAQLPDDVKDIWDNKSAEELVEEYALGGGGFVLGDIFDGSLDIIKNELGSRIGFIAKLLMLALLMGILTNAGKSLGKGISDIGGFVCYCLIAVIIAADFASMVSFAQSTITSINEFMQKVFPVLLTLLTALGGTASAGIFQPAMALLSGTVSTVVCGVVLPIILAMGMLAVISNMTDRAQLTQLYGLGKTTSKWILGFTFTMFFSVMSLQGITAASFDGISVRTAKFMIDKFVPIVGKMVSDTVDTVLGCTLIIKNALGISAIMIALMVIITPMLKIAASIFVYRIGAALIEPVADKRLTQMISMIADVSTYLFAALISVGAMFIISIGLIMSAGNANIMIR